MENFEVASTLNKKHISDDEKWFFKNADLKKRNLLRAVLYDDNTNIRKAIHKLRQLCTVQEIIVIENILNKFKTIENEVEIDTLVQNLFPKNPIIHNHHPSLRPLDLKRTLELISAYTRAC